MRYLRNVEAETLSTIFLFLVSLAVLIVINPASVLNVMIGVGIAMLSVSILTYIIKRIRNEND